MKTINLTDLTLKNVDIKHNNKKVTVIAQDVFDQLSRFVYTHGENELNYDVKLSILEENSDGEVEVFKELPFMVFEKLTSDILEKGMEKVNGINFMV